MELGPDLAEQEKIKKLERPYESYWLAGVCAGLSSYFGINVITLRILFILFSLIGGIGIIAYFLLMLKMPLEDFSELEDIEKIRIKKNNFRAVSGTLLFTGGFYYVLHVIGAFDSFWLLGSMFYFFTPLFVILAGLLLFKNYSSQSMQEIKSPEELKKSNVEKRITGVCGGFANYLNADATVVRMCWIFSVFATLGIMFIVYVLFAVFLTSENKVSLNDE